MNVTSVFIDNNSFNATQGQYGIAYGRSDIIINPYGVEQFISKPGLVDCLQEKLNAAAAMMAELPEEADRTEVTSRWKTLSEILSEVKNIV